MLLLPVQIKKAFVVTIFLGCMVEPMVEGEHTHCIARVTKIYMYTINKVVFGCCLGSV